MMVFAAGDKVHSVKVGRVPAFDGVVAEVFDRKVVEVRTNTLSRPFEGYYHVRDPKGILWHRDQSDLEAAS